MIEKLNMSIVKKNLIGLLLVGGLTSCSDIVEEPDISLEKVKIIAPVNQTEVKGNVVNFTWESVADADSYLLQVASPDFNQAAQVYIDSLIKNTSFTQELLPNDYQLRVKAVNSAYETAYTYSAFTVRKSDGFEGNTLLLKNPSNNYSTNVATVTYSWDVIEGAVAYQIQVLDESGTVLSDETIDTPSIELTMTEGNFRWQVRAINEAEEATLYSSRAILVDLRKPNTPKLIAPIDEGIESEGTVTFSWERESISGSTEIDSIYIYSDENQIELYKKGIGVASNYTTDMEVGNYFWKVKAFDTAGNISDDSNLNELTVQ